MSEIDDTKGGTFSALYAMEAKKKEVKMQPSNQATKQPRLQDTKVVPTDLTDIEIIRRAVKRTGKETTSYRLHEIEKTALDDILYQLKKQGLKSSENELMRIAINWLIADYKDKKKESVLVTVLERLLA